MGLFDKFGVGGGTVTVSTDATAVAAGESIRGTITFTGGKRAQKITSLLVWITRGPSTDINLVKGKVDEDRSGGTAPVGEKVVVSGPLTAEPGRTYAFPFTLQVPTRVMSSRTTTINGQPGPLLQPYRVWGTADIPGEIDKHGQGPNFEITGGIQLEVTTT